jgi:leucyl-tRNA---protein transferase
MLSEISWYLSNEHPCPYIDGNLSTNVFCQDENLNALSYEVLQEQGFRRSGKTFYRPQCSGCNACIPIRIKALDFKASKSQRKVRNKNQDIQIVWSTLTSDEEHLDLYNRYQDEIHQGMMSANKDGFEEMFSHEGYIVSEIQFRVDNKLIGVSIIDLGINSMSSVYFYYDPEYRERRLGIYSVLIEIQYCIEKNLDFWYGGYTIANCKKMEYKNQFKPAEYFYNKQWQNALPDAR